MTDQDIDIASSSAFLRVLHEKGEQLERLSRDADTIEWHTNPGITVLGVVVGLMMIVYVLTMSRNHTQRQQRETAEAERIQVAADMAEFKKMEKQRSHISKVVASWAIHLTSTSHNASAAIPSDKSCSNEQIPEGCEKDDVPIESVTISSSSEDDLEDIETPRDVGGDDELVSEDANASCCDTMQSTLAIGAAPSSSSVVSTMTQSKMREAVTHNPCPICLEPFKAGEDVVVCTNNHDGKTPHVFHQTCSLDYILAHKEKIKAPCPLCRNVLIPSKEKQRNEGCFRQSHRSALTLPDMDQV
jgi:hypothetical protein